MLLPRLLSHESVVAAGLSSRSTIPLQLVPASNDLLILRARESSGASTYCKQQLNYLNLRLITGTLSVPLRVIAATLFRSPRIIKSIVDLLITEKAKSQRHM